MAGVSTVLQGRWQWSIKIKWPNSRCKFRVLEEGYLRAQQNKRTNSNAWRPWKSTNGKRNQMLTFYFSIVLKILIGGSAKTAVAETRGTVDHRMQCSTLERVLHLERRTKSWLVPPTFRVRKDPVEPGPNKKNILTGRYTPFLQAAGRPSMGPLAVSLVRQRQGQPDIRDAKMRMTTWAWLRSENRCCFPHNRTTHTAFLRLIGARAVQRRLPRPDHTVL